jgi:hypothetical protein
MYLVGLRCLRRVDLVNEAVRPPEGEAADLAEWVVGDSKEHKRAIAPVLPEVDGVLLSYARQARRGDTARFGRLDVRPDWYRVR